MDNLEREFGWEDTITKDSEFIILPEGDYNFVVESFERGRHSGSDKMPACNKAILTLRVEAAEGTVHITHNLFLHTKTEGLLSAFFASIGQKKKGEPLRMNWNHVPGSSGKAKIGIRSYNGNNYNEIKRFYPREDGPAFKAGEF